MVFGDSFPHMRKILFGVFSGWGSQVASLLIGVFTMPIFFRYLPKDELGIWMFIMGTGFFVNLSDLGFSPVLGRQIAFELGKGDRNSSSKETVGTSYYYSLSRYVSSLTAPLLFIGLILFGGLFIYSFRLPEALLRKALMAWGVFCFAQALSCKYKYLETTLNSHGEVGWQNILQTVVQAVTLLGYFLVLHFSSWGIVGLSGIALFRNIAFASGLGWFLRRLVDPSHRMKVNVGLADVRPHLRPAWDMFLITLGTFLILNTDQYFITKFLGPAALPDYAAAYRLVQVAYIFSTTASAMCIPFISRKSAEGDQSSVHGLLMLNTTVGMVMQLMAVSLISVFGDYIIKIWLGEGHFVGWSILWVFCIMLTLENHHVIFARFGLSAKVDPSWGKMSVLAGAINLILTFFFIQWIGLLGVALATMLSQIMTNNWYAVVKTLNIIQLSFTDYLHSSGIVWFLSGSLLFLAMGGIRSVMEGPIHSLFTGILACLLLGGVTILISAKKYQRFFS